jgi:hypothetical protein
VSSSDNSQHLAWTQRFALAWDAAEPYEIRVSVGSHGFSAVLELRWSYHPDDAAESEIG